MKSIMTIGGTDSSGGAGLSRDGSVVQRFGFGVLPIVTAVTAQSHGRVFDVQIMPAGLVARQIEAAFASADPAAIKIGMLGNDDIATAVAAAIAGQSLPLVIDPVLKSSSGGRLMSGTLPRVLLEQASMITPNLPEAAALTGRPVAADEAEIKGQAQEILALGVPAVLVKGGHAEGDMSVDHLFTGSAHHILAAPRVNAALRGTGCALATAIACGLASGEDLRSACQSAKSLIHDQLCATSVLRF